MCHRPGARRTAVRAHAEICSVLNGNYIVFVANRCNSPKLFFGQSDTTGVIGTRPGDRGGVAVLTMPMQPLNQPGSAILDQVNAGHIQPEKTSLLFDWR